MAVKKSDVVTQELDPALEGHIDSILTRSTSIRKLGWQGKIAVTVPASFGTLFHLYPRIKHRYENPEYGWKVEFRSHREEGSYLLFS